MPECLNPNKDCIAKMVTFEEINRLIPKYLRENAWKKTQSFWRKSKAQSAETRSKKPGIHRPSH